MNRSTGFASVFAATLCLVVVSALTARAQMPSVLYGNTNAPSFVFEPIGSALSDLGLRPTEVFTAEDFLTALQLNRYDLVIFRGKERFREPFEFEIIAELEAHVARGGRLHFQMAELETAPRRLLDLLGLEAAEDLVLPLSDIELVPPQHPSVAGGGYLSLWDEFYLPDFGDSLVPSTGTTVTQRYVDSGRPSTVLSHAGRVMVNGQQWDNWTRSAGGFVAVQLSWLLRCPADLDLDEALTIADFLLFQNMFARGDVSADFDADGRLTVFDFLEFQNAFDAGCR